MWKQKIRLIAECAGVVVAYLGVLSLLMYPVLDAANVLRA